MIIRSPEPEVKIVVDRDPVKTSFEEWARPGYRSAPLHEGDLSATKCTGGSRSIWLTGNLHSQQESINKTAFPYRSSWHFLNSAFPHPNYCPKSCFGGLAPW